MVRLQACPAAVFCHDMKKLLLYLLLAPFLSPAQQVQYASKVLKYSSDLGGKQNSVRRILGKPDAFPQGGQNANAWVAKDASGTAYVEVEFEKAQTVRQIAIFQNLNAGCVNRVLLADASGKFHVVHKKVGNFRSWLNSLQPKINADRAYYFNKKRRKIEVAADVTNNADIEYIFPEKPEENIKMLRVEFNFAVKPGQKQIDALAISDSEEPLLPVMALLPGAEALANAEAVMRAADSSFDMSALSIIGNTLYYTVIGEGGESEIHAADLDHPDIIRNVSDKIKNNKKLNFIWAYAPGSQTVLVGSENRFRWDDSPLGFDFFSYSDGEFVRKQPVKVVAYSNYGDYADAFLSADGQRLLFALESDLTQGGFDIYFTTPKDAESYGMLQNMGKGLNTAADEVTPFLLSDNKTLIFSGNGYSGYGDFDLYVTTRLDDTWKNWSEPKNLGPKINGQSFELSPCYDEKNEVLYYIALRDGVTTIQRIPLPLAQLRQE